MRGDFEVSNDASESSKINLSETAARFYLAEYREVAESYRHTYHTIWQAAPVFLALSVVLNTFGEGLAQVFAPIPFLGWYLGIFLPMNRYGEWRSTRLKSLEELLNDRVPGLEMRHFKRYDEKRKGTERGVSAGISFLLKRLAKGHWRVHEFIRFIAILAVAVQAYLIYEQFA